MVSVRPEDRRPPDSAAAVVQPQIELAQGGMIFLAFLFVGAGLVLAGLIPESSRKHFQIEDPGWPYFFGGFAALLVPLGAFCGWWAAKNGPENHPLMRQLRERPDEIVWVHPLGAPVKKIVQGIDMGTSDHVYFRKDDGTHHAIEMKVEKIGPLLTQLAPLLPGATIGFSPELLERYKQDPKSLRR